MGGTQVCSEACSVLFKNPVSAEFSFSLLYPIRKMQGFFCKELIWQVKVIRVAVAAEPGSLWQLEEYRLSRRQVGNIARP